LIQINNNKKKKRKKKKKKKKSTHARSAGGAGTASRPQPPLTESWTGSVEAPCSYMSRNVRSSCASSENWIGPGLRYLSTSRHSSRTAANTLKGPLSSSTRALRITGFILPLRFSMFISEDSGTAPTTQSRTGPDRFRIDAM
jgi:hypothetical protein